MRGLSLAPLFPPCHRGKSIPDTSSAGTRVGFPEHPALHGTWFLQTAEVSAALPRLACQWHRASKALGSCNLASYPPFWPPSLEGWSESWGCLPEPYTFALYARGWEGEPVVGGWGGGEGGLPLPGTLPPVIPGRLLLGFYIVQRKVIFSEPPRF